MKNLLEHTYKRIPAGEKTLLMKPYHIIYPHECNQNSEAPFDREILANEQKRTLKVVLQRNTTPQLHRIKPIPRQNRSPVPREIKAHPNLCYNEAPLHFA